MKNWKYIPAVVALIVILGINEITVQAEGNNEEINVKTTSDVFIDGTEYSYGCDYQILFTLIGIL
jgi:hypothetical protein